MSYNGPIAEPPAESSNPLEGVRTMLFVPGSDRHRCGRALEAGADVVILDLEDGVAASAKGDARAVVEEVLEARQPGPLAVVRINPPGSPDGDRDLEALARMRADAVVLPKADAETGPRVAGTGLPAIALIETAAGVLEADRVARLEHVALMMFGPADLSSEIGSRPGVDGHELLYARSRLVLASAVAGLPAPIDGPCLSLDDPDLLRAEAVHARNLGFGGKACIHPRQLDEVRTVFAPTPDELAWAGRVVAAFEAARADGEGVVSVDGQMIDLPVARRAYAILERKGS